MECVQVGQNKNGRLAGVGSSDDSNRIAIPVGGNFIDLEFGQSFHENFAAPFLPECRCRRLTDQYDVGNNYLFESFDLIDKSR
jgi:hypothetical protein